MSVRPRGTGIEELAITNLDGLDTVATIKVCVGYRVDGKVLRGSGRHDGKPLQLLSAVTHHLRLTLDQVAIEAKSNEIPALKPLLKKLDLPPNTLITADAMHCQQESARCITQELGGDYLFGLKGNQSGILEQAQHLLTQQGFPPTGSMG